MIRDPDSTWEPFEAEGELFAEVCTRTDTLYKGSCVVTIRGAGGRYVIGQLALEAEPALERLVGQRVRASGKANWVRQADGSRRKMAFNIDSIELATDPVTASGSATSG